MDLIALKKIFPGKVLDYEYPKAHPNILTRPEKIRAIVLGCDPSNFSNRDKSTNLLETVFGISGEGKDGRYFSGILRNLKLLGLSLDDIYVQNLCRNYFDKETKKNPIWFEAAGYWRDTLKSELDTLKISKTTLVFLTAQHLYLALIKENIEKLEPTDIYDNPRMIPIMETDNYLGRPLIPLFRGGKGNAYS